MTPASFSAWTGTGAAAAAAAVLLVGELWQGALHGLSALLCDAGDVFSADTSSCSSVPAQLILPAALQSVVSCGLFLMLLLLLHLLLLRLEAVGESSICSNASSSQQESANCRMCRAVASPASPRAVGCSRC